MARLMQIPDLTETGSFKVNLQSLELNPIARNTLTHAAGLNVLDSYRERLASYEQRTRELLAMPEIPARKYTDKLIEKVTKTKLERAFEMFDPTVSRSNMIAKYMTQLGMSKAGASSYYGQAKLHHETYKTIAESKRIAAAHQQQANSFREAIAITRSNVAWSRQQREAREANT